MGYYEEGEQYFLHAYGRYDTVLDHGEGVYLYDTEGNKYLDFYSGIAWAWTSSGRLHPDERLQSCSGITSVLCYRIYPDQPDRRCSLWRD